MTARKTTTTTKPATNGEPDSTDVPRTRAEIKAKIEAIQASARHQYETDKDRKAQERAYLRSLLAHPAADGALRDARCLMDQTRDGGDEADSMVGVLVLVEAMKALREKVDVPD